VEERSSVSGQVLGGGGVMDHMAFGCCFPEHLGDGLGCGVKVASFRCLSDLCKGLGVSLDVKCEVLCFGWVPFEGGARVGWVGCRGWADGDGDGGMVAEGVRDFGEGPGGVCRAVWGKGSVDQDVI
jgi:hypothetical protein